MNTKTLQHALLLTALAGLLVAAPASAQGDGMDDEHMDDGMDDGMMDESEDSPDAGLLLAGIAIVAGVVLRRR